MHNSYDDRLLAANSAAKGTDHTRLDAMTSSDPQDCLAAWPSSGGGFLAFGLDGLHEPLPPDSLESDHDLNALLESQRKHLARMRSSNHRRPQVGDLWTSWEWGWSHRREATVRATEPEFASTFVVLRTFVDEWTQRPLLDVAPVTTDDWYAADWSVVFSAEDSGIGTPVVLHVDVQCTTVPHRLDRWLGQLTKAACTDLLSVMRAFERGEPIIVDLKVGRLGRAAIRTRSEWAELADQLFAMCAAIAVALDELSDVEAAAEQRESTTEDVRSTIQARAGPRREQETVQATPSSSSADDLVSANLTRSSPHHSCRLRVQAESGSLNIDVSTLEDIVQQYLWLEFQGDLRRWALKYRRKHINWHLLRPFASLPAATVLSARDPRALSQALTRFQLPARPPHQDVLMLVQLATRRLTARERIEGETIVDRAARRTNRQQ